MLPFCYCQIRNCLFYCCLYMRCFFRMLLFCTPPVVCTLYNAPILFFNIVKAKKILERNCFHPAYKFKIMSFPASFLGVLLVWSFCEFVFFLLLFLLYFFLCYAGTSIKGSLIFQSSWLLNCFWRNESFLHKAPFTNFS